VKIYIKYLSTLQNFSPRDRIELSVEYLAVLPTTFKAVSVSNLSIFARAPLCARRRSFTIEPRKRKATQSNAKQHKAVQSTAKQLATLSNAKPRRLRLLEMERALVETDHTVSNHSENELKEAITLEVALSRIPLGLFQWRLLCMCGFAFMADAVSNQMLLPLYF
jgi:hypothetical protein